jgi:hypothetical protein
MNSEVPSLTTWAVAPPGNALMMRTLFGRTTAIWERTVRCCAAVPPGPSGATSSTVADNEARALWAAIICSRSARASGATTPPAVAGGGDNGAGGACCARATGPAVNANAPRTAPAMKRERGIGNILSREPQQRERWLGPAPSL